MDSLNLALFLAAAFFGGLTSGLSGFAMGLVVSGVWLHIIAPDQNALLIVLCGLVTQGSGIWRVRTGDKLADRSAFIVGGALGVPAGTALLTTVDQHTLRLSMGVLLVIFSLYSLIRPTSNRFRALCPRFGVGIANGLIGGLTGLGGIVVTNLVPIARRPQRRATRDLSAGDILDVSDERNFARRGRRIHHRDAQTLRARRCPRSLQVSGWASNSMASSMTRRFARSSWFFALIGIVVDRPILAGQGGVNDNIETARTSVGTNAPSFREFFKVWLKIGCINFGGRPARSR
jgi:hypothetical protein